jgi:hypothetical protein
MGERRGRKNEAGLFSPAAKNPGRKGDDRFEQVEDGADRDPKEPKGQQEEPDYWIKNERQKGQRPAEHQQNQPEQKFDHQRTSQDSGESSPSDGIFHLSKLHYIYGSSGQQVGRRKKRNDPSPAAAILGNLEKWGIKTDS